MDCLMSDMRMGDILSLFNRAPPKAMPGTVRYISGLNRKPLGRLFGRGGLIIGRREDGVKLAQRQDTTDCRIVHVQ